MNKVILYTLLFLSLTPQAWAQTPSDTVTTPPNHRAPPVNESTAPVQNETPAPVQNETEKTSTEKAGERVKEVAKDISAAINEAREQRAAAKAIVLFNYAPLDMLIPSKTGGTIGWVKTAGKTWELEYLSGSISVPFLIKDLGEMKDKRISIIGRSFYENNSFNFSYGLSYFDFSVNLGDDLLNRISSGSYPSIDLITIQSLGFNMAFGNRWSFSHGITFGVDWFSWEQPLFTTTKDDDYLNYVTNANDRENVADAIKFISYCPRLSFAKLQLGIMF